jgi:hypothetical protein
MQRREGSDRWGRPLQPSVKLIRLAELRSAGLIRGHRPSFLRGSPCRCLYAKEHPLDPWTMFLSCRPAAAGYAGLLTLRDRLNACDAVLRNHLDPHERVLAVGRCEDITIRGSIDSPGWTYVMITNARLRWVPDADPRFEAALAFSSVTAARERSSKHRYAIHLEHAPLTRPHWAPAHRFLAFEWGNRVVTTPLTRTVLAFSRRDTEAAIALRGRLSKGAAA